MRKCRHFHHLEGWDSPEHSLMESYMEVSRLHRMVMERQLNKTGVYRSQHQILMYIADNPNASQKEIAMLHHVSTATIAVSLKKLENGGYIKRVVDQEDNRFNQICITEKGSAVVEQSLQYFQKLDRLMFDGFGREELERFQQYMDRVRDNLRSLLPETEREERE